MLQVNYSGKFNMQLQMPILVQWKSSAPTKVGCLQLDDEAAEFESRHLAKSKPLLKILPSTRGPHGDVKRKKGGEEHCLDKRETIAPILITYIQKNYQRENS